MDNPADKKAVREGNAAGVSTTFLKYRSSLMRYISRYIHQPQDIEDIVHETFLRTYAAGIGTQIQSPRAFLFKTAKNLALKHLDKCSVRLTEYVGDLEALEVSMDEYSTEARVETQERFLAFCRAVRTLPLQCRRVFILRKVYGLTQKEVAEQLDISVSTVEKHLAQGIIRCHRYMRSRGFHYQSPAGPADQVMVESAGETE
jgi:RNA polymerase sigma factor (sigma-70 family)